MNKLVETMLTKDEYTANGAVTNSTSLNSCLDLFFLAGACRTETIKNIETKLQQAYLEDRVTTLKIIFWAGDIRQGAGERRFLKIALNWLLNNHKEDLFNYIEYVPEFSRWDVLFELDHPFVLDYIYKNMSYKDGSKPNSLLCKWLPRKKQYNNLAKKIQKLSGLTPKQYRKFLVEHTDVVEQKMCANEWLDINYSHVPSVALHKYNKAWYKHDEQGFKKYIEDVKNGKAKINASAIFPHDIIKKAVNMWGSTPLTEAEITQWDNLPNYLEGKSNSIIPVCDVSGSMYGLPMEISVALGLYISERNEGVFKDAFITFSKYPQMQYLKGNLQDRINQLKCANWDMNTDFVKVFALILDKAVKNNLQQSDLPETVLVISDMEFDQAENGKTNFEHIKEMFKESGYELPKLVFWNVNGRANNLPITVKDQNVALVSGASPSILKSVLSNDINPLNIMYSVINVPRYEFIK